MKTSKGSIDPSKRQFLKNVSLTSASLMTSGSLTSAAIASTDLSNRIKNWVIFDGLGGLYDMNTWQEETDADPMILGERLKKDLRASGLTSYRQTTGVVYPAYPGDNPFEQAVSVIAWQQQWIRKNSDILMLAQSVEDILEAKKTNKVAVTLGFQNSHVLGNDLSRVDTFKNLGVLTMQLTYNGKNQLGGGANVSGRIPLSKFGREAIEKMNASNIIVDLSHGGERTTLEAIEASKQPITIGHTGCRALADFPRNKTDEEMKKLADKGGLLGVYFMPFLAPDSKATSQHLIAHIEHAINVCGEDHVSIGTDGSYGGVDDLEKVRKKFNVFTKKRIDEGNAAAGEKIDNLNFLPDLVGPTMFSGLADKLSARGHGDARIEKVLGLNALAYMKEVWGN